MRGGQVDELLVVRVLAHVLHGRGDVHQARLRVEGGQHLRGIHLVVVHARDDVRIGQHTLELIAHDLRGDPVQAPLCQQRPQRHGGGVREDQQVERDIGVHHYGACRLLRRCLGGQVQLNPHRAGRCRQAWRGGRARRP